ncbi:MAG: DUF2232 domain-containing protein [Rhodospirillales bacterium]|nr:DUF2232 domain-containing protein [Rhodospirillales bacterium]MDP6643416.1 DUF2232 domain-containing protein [Rhodospirillales bacterium]MDP6841834.1 DUF2232 domain-containing protein [Rhodospirillales bacterium]
MIIAMAGGLASAALSLGVLTGSGAAILFAYFSPLPLLLVGLSLGLTSVSVGIALAAILVAWVAGATQAAIYGISLALPVWLITRYAIGTRKLAGGSAASYSAGDILARMAVLGGLLLIFTALMTASNEGGFAGAVRSFVDTILGARLAASGAIDREMLVDRLVPLFPAATALSWLVMFVINATLAQSFIRKAGKNLRSQTGYAQITVPEWFYWIFVAVAAIALVASGPVEYLARNLVVVLSAPFLFAGLGVIHILVQRVALPGMALTAFYIFIILFSWAGFVVAWLGFLEPWVRLRERYRQPPGTDTEDE